MNRIRTRAFWAGAALIVATNAVVLGGVAYNRSGEPDSVLRLTQRELPAPYAWGLTKENSGLALEIAWRAVEREGSVAQQIMSNSYAHGNAPQWLDEAKLAALGIDVEKLRYPEGERRRPDWLPSKEVFLVLEFDGPAYRALLEKVREFAASAEETLRYGPNEQQLQQPAKAAAEALKREEQANSRLVVIDAGLDRDGLRAAYPDRARYAIVRARIQAEVADGTRKPRGRILGLSVEEINVPASFRGVVGNARVEPAPASPVARYELTVKFGKRLESWITAASKPGP